MGDLIRRSETIKMIDPCCRNDEEFQFFKILIEAVPSVEAVPVVHSSWGDSEYVWECNHCSSWFEVTQGDGDMNFCPNCGAKMEGNKVE